MPDYFRSSMDREPDKKAYWLLILILHNEFSGVLRNGVF